nr:hypothetical protein [uncultured Draconibacterium sp.]
MKEDQKKFSEMTREEGDKWLEAHGIKWVPKTGGIMMPVSKEMREAMLRRRKGE